MKRIVFQIAFFALLPWVIPACASSTGIQEPNPRQDPGSREAVAAAQEEPEPAEEAPAAEESAESSTKPGE